MKVNVRFQFILGLFLVCKSFAVAQPALSDDPTVKPAADFERIFRVAVPERPFLYVNRNEITVARNRAENEAWAKTIRNNYLKIADTWIKRDYDFVKKIIPLKGSIYTYGLGLDLDPVQAMFMLKEW